MQLVSQLNRIIENYIRYMDDIALMAANNEDVRTFIADPEADTPRLRSAIRSTFQSFRAVRRDIDSVFVITRGRAGHRRHHRWWAEPHRGPSSALPDLEAGVVPDRPPCPRLTWRTSSITAIPG